MIRTHHSAEKLAQTAKLCLFPGSERGRQVLTGGVAGPDSVWVRELSAPDEDDSYYPVSVRGLGYIW